jgi:predicted nucleic acid-binding protein
VLVVDASLLVVALADDGSDGEASRARLRGQNLVAPELLDLEVALVLRRHTSRGGMALKRAELALRDLLVLPIQRAPHRPLLARAWELRENLTIYDAVYVALAEVVEAPLLTGDGRLARAPGVRCHVEVFKSSL